MLSPKDLAAQVDPRCVFVRLTPYEDVIPLKPLKLPVEPPANIEVNFWGNVASLNNGDRSRNDMANAANEGRTVGLNWDGLTTGQASATKIYSIWLSCRAEINVDPVVAQGRRGTSRVRMYFSLDNRTVLTEYLAAETDPIGVPGIISSPSADATIYKFNVTRHVKQWLGLGNDITVGDLEARADEIRVQFSAFTGEEGLATWWYVNDVYLDIDIMPDSGNRFQTSLQVQVTLAADTSFAAPIYDSGKMGWAEDTWLIPSGDPGVVTGAGIPFATDGLLIRARRWGKDDNASPWTATLSFSTLPLSTINMLTTGKAVFVVVLHPGIWIDAGEWRQFDVSRVNVHAARLDRDDFQIKNWWVEDIEEDGAPKGYTELISANPWFFVNLTENSFEWVEHKELTYPPISSGVPADAVQGEIYVHPTERDAAHAMSPAGFLGGGLMIRCGMAFASGNIKTGQNNAYQAMPRLRGIPSFEDTLLNLGGGGGRTASGSVTLWNGDNKLSEIFGEAPRGSVRRAFVWQERPVTIYLQEPGQPFDEALIIFRGTMKMPDAVQKGKNEIAFEIRGESFDFRRSEIASESFSDDYYADIDLYEPTSGSVIPEAFGEKFINRPLWLVEESSKLFRPLLHCNAVTKVSHSGKPLETTEWTYDGVHVLVFDGAFDPPDPLPPEALTDGDWTFSGDGELFEGSTSYKAGTVARMLILKTGFDAALIDTASFTAMDNQPWCGPIRMTFDTPKPILDVLKEIEQTGLFNVTRRANGFLEAIPENPVTFDNNDISIAAAGGFSANTLVLDNSKVRVVPLIIDQSWIKRTLRVSYESYGDDDLTPLEVSKTSRITEAVYRNKSELSIATLNDNRSNTKIFADNIDIENIRELRAFETTLYGLLGYPGEQFLLLVKEGISHDSTLLWDLYQMTTRRLSGLDNPRVQLIGRFLHRLVGFERPW